MWHLLDRLLRVPKQRLNVVRARARPSRFNDDADQLTKMLHIKVRVAVLTHLAIVVR